MEVKHTMYVVKCLNSKCGNPIRLSEGRFLGGFNDRGGVVIKCDECKTVFPCRLINPKDASGVLKGGKVLDTWTDDFPRYLTDQYKITEEQLNEVEKAVVFGYEEPPAPTFIPSTKPCFTDALINFENESFTALGKLTKEVNDQYSMYYNLYVKGRYSAEKSFVQINYEISGEKYQAVFAKRIPSERDLNLNNLYLIHHSHVKFEEVIDGIFTRDESMLFLERMLNRWRYMANEVLLVVPFIGFNFPTAQDALIELWNWLEIHVDVEKTNLVTRKGTFNLFKKAQDSTGIPYEELVKWGLLEPLKESMEKGDMTYFQKSHAKYYVGVYEEFVEVLVGSFNIHAGSYFENVSFRRYTKTFFLERYLHMLKNFQYASISSNEQVHHMVLGDSKQKNHTTDLQSLIKEINGIN